MPSQRRYIHEVLSSSFYRDSVYEVLGKCTGVLSCGKSSHVLLINMISYCAIVTVEIAIYIHLNIVGIIP